MGTAIWLIFTALFSTLAILHYLESRTEIAAFRTDLKGKVAKISGIETGLTDLRDFVGHFNDYIDNYNRSTKRAHLFATAGFTLAALTAVVSFVLSCSGA